MCLRIAAMLASPFPMKSQEGSNVRCIDPYNKGDKVMECVERFKS